MSLIKITYYKFRKDVMVGVESHEDFYDSEELYLIPPALFYTEAYEVDYYYTWVGGAIGRYITLER